MINRRCEEELDDIYTEEFAKDVIFPEPDIIYKVIFVWGTRELLYIIYLADPFVHLLIGYYLAY